MLLSHNTNSSSLSPKKTVWAHENNIAHGCPGKTVWMHENNIAHGSPHKKRNKLKPYSIRVSNNTLVTIRRRKEEPLKSIAQASENFKGSFCFHEVSKIQSNYQTITHKIAA